MRIKHDCLMVLVSRFYSLWIMSRPRITVYRSLEDYHQHRNGKVSSLCLCFLFFESSTTIVFVVLAHVSYLASP